MRRRYSGLDPGKEEELVSRNILKLAPGGMGKILAGVQSSTTRLGLRKYTLGSGLLVDGHSQIHIWICLLQTLVFEALNSDHARIEGFMTTSALKEKIRRFYPDIRSADRVTHVQFYVLNDEIDISPQRRRRWPAG